MSNELKDEVIWPNIDSSPTEWKHYLPGDPGPCLPVSTVIEWLENPPDSDEFVGTQLLAELRAIAQEEET